MENKNSLRNLFNRIPGNLNIPDYGNLTIMKRGNGTYYCFYEKMKDSNVIIPVIKAKSIIGVAKKMYKFLIDKKYIQKGKTTKKKKRKITKKQQLTNNELRKRRLKIQNRLLKNK